MIRATKGLAVFLMAMNAPLWAYIGQPWFALAIVGMAWAQWRWLPEE